MKGLIIAASLSALILAGCVRSTEVRTSNVLIEYGVAGTCEEMHTLANSLATQIAIVEGTGKKREIAQYYADALAASDKAKTVLATPIDAEQEREYLVRAIDSARNAGCAWAG